MANPPPPPLRHHCYLRCRRRRSGASPSLYLTTTAPRRPGVPAPAGGRWCAAWGSAPCGFWRGGGLSSCSFRPSRCSSSRPRGSAPLRAPPRQCPALAASTRPRASSMACASVSPLSCFDLRFVGRPQFPRALVVPQLPIRVVPDSEIAL
jgi:hypothetical protein